MTERGRGKIPAPACGGGEGERSKQGEGEFSCRMSTARHIPPPLAGVGTGGRNDRAREGANPRPRLRGRGLRAKREGGGGIQLQDVYGQAYNNYAILLPNLIIITSLSMGAPQRAFPTPTEMSLISKIIVRLVYPRWKHTLSYLVCLDI